MKGKKVSEVKLIHEKCFGKDVAKVSLRAVQIRAGETKMNCEIRKVKYGDQCEWV